MNPPAHRAFNVRRHWAGGPRGALLLIAACLLLHLPGLISLPPIDRDESRFAEASRHMHVADQWVVPRVGDKLRLSKPPLIYWLQAGTARLILPASAAQALYADGTIWTYRLPSLAGALVAVLLTWRLGCAMFAPPIGLWAGLLLATCAVVMIDVRQARVDQVLLALTTAAQLALWQLWRRRNRDGAGRMGWVVLLWIAVGLGMLAKGPVTPAVVALTAVALSAVARQWRWLRTLHWPLGLLLVALLVMPWLALAAREVGWDRLRDVVHQEVIERGLSSKEGHWGWPGYYLTLLPGLFWPGSLALIPAAMVAWQRGLRTTRNGRRWPLRPGRDAELFCLAWLVPGWILFELAGTKLPHYTLPMFPALALLAARGLFAVRRAWRPLLSTDWGWMAVWGWLILSQVLAVILPLVMAWLGQLASHIGLIIVVIGLAILNQALIVVVAIALHQRRFLRAQGAALIMAGMMQIGLLGVILPNLPTLWLSSRVVAELKQVDPGAERPIAAVGYHEDSIVFLTAGRAKRLSWHEVDDWRTAHPNGLLVALEEPWDALPDARELARVAGLNYANGRWQTLRLLESPATDGTEPPTDIKIEAESPSRE